MRILFVLILFVVFSCKNDEPAELKNPQFFFFNETGVEIDMIVYRNQRFDDRFNIPSEKGKNMLAIGYGESVPKSKVPTGFPPLPYHTDYILVVYDKKDSIFHSTRLPESNSLYNENSYEFLMIDDIPSYDFIFTEDDYEYAKR